MATAVHASTIHTFGLILMFFLRLLLEHYWHFETFTEAPPARCGPGCPVAETLTDEIKLHVEINSVGTRGGGLCSVLSQLHGKRPTV